LLCCAHTCLCLPAAVAPSCSIQLIPAANGFDSVSAQKDVAHLPAIQAETGVAYAQMLFFDDEHPNIRKVHRG
jgi:hypothetical protein